MKDEVAELMLILSMLNDVNDPNYHAPEVAWDQEWKGQFWDDMIGWDESDQKLSFALFRRGLNP